MYKHFFKRFLDFWISLIVLICISPILIVVYVMLTILNKGAGALFFQERPGKDEKMEFKVNGSKYYVIESKEFEIDLFSEVYYFTSDLSGLIYFSHEDTISFAGELFINMINELNIPLTRILKS